MSQTSHRSANVPAAGTSPPRIVEALPERRRSLLIDANLRAAVRALQANRLRSFLTMLGVIIGVGAVIAAVTLTQGVSANINNRFAQLGTNRIYIIPGSGSSEGVSTGLGTASSLTLGDASAVAGMAHVTNVSPILAASGLAIYRNQNWTTGVYGVYPTYQQIANLQIAEGIWFSQSDETAATANAVLGSAVVQNLFGPLGIDPLGQTIRFNGQLLHVVGILQAQGTQSDNAIFLPLSAVQQRLASSSHLSQINVQVDNVNNVAQVQQDITTLLETRHHIPQGTEDDFRAYAPSQLIQNAQSNASVLTGLFIGIAAISLTVGGIGIMNIMLVSVAERTREIGIRMAVGARRCDIRNQFLIEAVILSVIGGVLGIVIGLVVGYELVAHAQLPFVMSAFSVLLPVGVAAAVGIVFGLYPAVLASRLDPIVALRTE